MIICFGVWVLDFVCYIELGKYCLFMNEDRKFLFIYFFKVIWGNRNRIINEWFKYEFVLSLGISLDF